MTENVIPKKDIQAFFEARMEDIAVRTRSYNFQLQRTCFEGYAASTGLLHARQSFLNSADDLAGQYKLSVYEIKELIESAYENVYNKLK